jgi:ribosome-binding factor A
MSIRTERLAAQLKRDLGPILQEYQMGSMITITTVRVSDDLMVAKIYLSIFAPSGNSAKVFDYIMEHIVPIRASLATLIRHQVRRIPELHFYMDDTAEYVNKIEGLFKQIQQDREKRETD